VRLLGRKLLLTFNRSEVVDSESLEVYADYSRLLRGLTWFTFGALLPLASLGAWHWRREWRRLALLHAWVVGLAGSVVLFYVMARYRYPLVPVIALFASAGLVAIPELVRGGRREWLPGLIIAAAVAIAANVPLKAGYDATYANVGAQLLHAGRAAEALTLLEKGVEAAPVHAPGRVYLGMALAATGDKVRAREQFAAALAQRPDYSDAHVGLALAMQDLGYRAGAIRHLEEAVRLTPESSLARGLLARLLTDAGRRPEAMAQYRELLRLTPDDYAARMALAAALAEEGIVEEAITQYEAAIGIRPDSIPAIGSLAQLRAGLGRLDEAVADLERALVLARAAGRVDAEREIDAAIRACRARMAAQKR
jgi:tetratricopeptide (TPR) repeat protein